ncbi:MAG: sulfatase-like hydrolase/transferase, partial [Planctomycetes bacterium]|nr:sulfatase-like hydrolase/transferase [Planctomycetota bacterium]
MKWHMNVPKWAGLLIFFCTLPFPFVDASEKRPNILFILSDDHRWDAMSCMNHSFVKTPHMDRLVAEGAHFENAFCTTSLCSPSRGTFYTGTYPHKHGVMGNDVHRDFDPAITPPWYMLLKQSGYHTGFIGKWHMGKGDHPRPGVDYWLSFNGQGVYHDPPVNENGEKKKLKGYMTEILTDKAISFLRNRPNNKPFAAVLSHKAVHAPFTPEEKYKNTYDDDAVKEPPTFQDDFKGRSPWRMLRYSGTYDNPITSEKLNNPNFTAKPMNWNSWSPVKEKKFINYFRALLSVDDSIGRVLKELEDQKILDNTMIIYAGDNGFFHGEHRRTDKRFAQE